jgi:hypothetical protein
MTPPRPLPTLPVQRAGELSAAPVQTPWLVQDLWSDQAVGILGGEPKCCKSFLALDLALSVASGTPCLRRFAVARSGPVLFFPAEDSLAIVRQRLDGLAAAAALDLTPLPLHVITAPVLRLDLATDQQRLTHTVAALQPILLILDPLIRLHQRDENDASQIAPLLGFLRQLQRQHHLAVVLVHHAKKDGAALRPGQALRGSSELHGWGDSNLYLRRHHDQLTLTVEHRAAPACEPIPLQLVQVGAALSLNAVNPPPARMTHAVPLRSARQRILDALAQAAGPLSVQRLRQRAGLRTATVCDLLRALTASGQVARQPDGYRLADTALAPSPSPPEVPDVPGREPRTNRAELLPEPLSQLPWPVEPPGNGNGKRTVHPAAPSPPAHDRG